KAGAEVKCRASVNELSHRANHWQIRAGGEALQARIIVNAAGAWADHVAELAGVQRLGLTPFRRTIAQVRLDQALSADLPLTIHIGGDFYFKPESGGQLWLSPHDETPSPPCDAAPEEFDIALALDRFSQVLEHKIEAVTHSWAGLRTFSPDRLPVYGFDPQGPGFFWCAGQGGFGIQTAPAAARLCAATILGQNHDANLREIEPALYSPARFRR
ncbi:MAG: hypothetical protein RL367_1144, partial [Pseudomonadota bacterium]